MLLLSLALACAPNPDASTSGSGGDPDECAWEAPTNTWPASTPPGCPEAEGFRPGQIVPDMRLMDQHGDTVSLWQFHGDVVLLDFSSMWTTQMWPEELATVGAEHAGAGLMSVSVLVEDIVGDVPDQDELLDWAAHTGAVGPVLADTDDVFWTAVSDEPVWPYILLIDRESRVIEDGLHWQEPGRIREAVESHL